MKMGSLTQKVSQRRYFQNLTFMKLEQKGKLGWLIFGFSFLCSSDKPMNNCPAYHVWLWAGQPTLMSVKVNLSDQQGASLSQLEKRWCPILTLLQSHGSDPQEKNGHGLHLGSRMGYLPCDTEVSLGQSKKLLLLMNVNFHSDFYPVWTALLNPHCFPQLSITDSHALMALVTNSMVKRS